jgi:CarD family transcriptional regulator
MSFQIGDIVVHETYGPGVVVQIDHKAIEGRPTDCYVVNVTKMTVWVPLSRALSGSLRPPTPEPQFVELLEILRSPGQPLARDRLERRKNLVARLNSGTLEAVCFLVRDLTALKRTGKMNDHDKIILERSRNLLLGEWEIVFSIPSNQAEQTLRQLLEETVLKPSVAPPITRGSYNRSG